MKRLWLVAALLAATVTHALGAGTIAFSLSQQLDSQGKPLSGGKLYFYSAGTSAPQTAYSDAALTIALPNPLTLDSSGRVPQFFLADGAIKIRLDDRSGVTVIAADNILVVGASSGSGSGASIDATTILDTGDIKARYGVGALSGFVRLNGRTIGSATSGATERANADTQALFLYLYNTDLNLAVSGGRGSDAASDWAANKTITLPDARGRVMAGLDDMGNSAANRLTTAGSGIDGTNLGTVGGAQSLTIAQGNLPVYNLTPSVTGTISSASIAMPVLNVSNTSSDANINFLSPSNLDNAGTSYWVGSVSAAGNGLNTQVWIQTPATVANTVTTVTGNVSITGTVPSGGSGTALASMPPAITMTFYMKL